MCVCDYVFVVDLGYIVCVGIGCCGFFCFFDVD